MSVSLHIPGSGSGGAAPGCLLRSIRQCQPLIGLRGPAPEARDQIIHLLFLHLSPPCQKAGTLPEDK